MRKSATSATKSAAQHVYFIHDESSKKVKIGFSDDVSRRQKDIQACNGNDLVLLGMLHGGRDVEKKTHELFAPYRIDAKREWFRAPKEVLSSIRLLLIQGGCPRTVQDELSRRMDCRYGLRGVKVCLRGNGAEVFVVEGREWDHRERLKVYLLSEEDHAEKCRIMNEKFPSGLIKLSELMEINLPQERIAAADDCFLMSDWPVVCSCWLS